MQDKSFYGGNMEREEITVLDEGVEIDEMASHMVCCKPMPSASK
jgi:hypothetical protein